ncbi:MAG: hypothetical protein KDE14_03010 [Rhodobacteraceae bacterium]|nr:hypothetical protein [Paracoccaceae bacterium]
MSTRTLSGQKVITEDYRKMLADLHASSPQFGELPNKEFVLEGLGSLIGSTNAKTLLDYGCGKGVLKQHAAALWPDVEVFEYDPAIPGKDTLPQPADIVACIDVMEHIEQELVDDVMDYLAVLTKHVFFTTIALSPAFKTLPDGRNAHITLMPPDWWFAKIQARFTVHKFKPLGKHWVYALCTKPAGEPGR